jgi:hypothetical protein
MGDDDEVRGDNGIWRFMLVVGLLMGVISLGGGLRVSAEELGQGGDDVDGFRDEVWEEDGTSREDESGEVQRSQDENFGEIGGARDRSLSKSRRKLVESMDDAGVNEHGREAV